MPYILAVAIVHPGEGGEQAISLVAKEGHGLCSPEGEQAMSLFSY